MEVERKIRSNWLTRKPDPKSYQVVGTFLVLFALASLLLWTNLFDANTWMTATPENVFKLHEYWRPWTTLFAHGDLSHLLSNSLLFSAFAYLLYGHFGSWVFPGAAFLFGGLTNIIVLTTLPQDTQLLGASGIVYWMAPAWLTLYLYIDSRDKLARRALKVIGVAVMLLVPETFQPNVSYLSHFVGFILGIVWAVFYYCWHRAKFLNAEVVEYVIEDEELVEGLSEQGRI